MHTPPARTSCPNLSTLAKLLRDELADDEAPGVEAHVGGCDACQLALQRLVGSMPQAMGLPASRVSDEEPPELPGHESEGRIDAGGMGVVWRVRDLQFRRTLALKVMKSAACDDPNAARRFLDEARITGQLSHPSVVPVHAMGLLPDGRPYFTMKLVEGETLAALLDRPDVTSRRMELVRIFTQVCHAVAHAHTRGVVHRDLKPANVMVGAFGEVQVMDWGLAKSTRGEEQNAPIADSGVTHQDELGATRAGTVMGTLPYMSPEQALGEVSKIDPRCDVFNLGAILCEILTGDPPYRADVRDEVLRQAANGELASAFARLDACGADAELLQLAKACLAPNRDDRPPHAGAVAEAAAAYQARVEERLRWAEVERARAKVQSRGDRKRRRLASGLALAVFVGLVGLTVGAWLLGQKNRQLVAANGQLDSARAEAEAKCEQAARARDRTFEALDSMTSSVTGDSLETQALMSPEQKRFLDAVLSYYEEFAREQGDDGGTRKRVASAAHRVGLIQYRLSNHEAGVRAFEQARDAYRNLAVEFPADREYRFHLARNLNNLGTLLRELGRFREAEETCREAVSLREKLMTELPAAQDREDLASSYNNLGVLLRDAGKPREAEPAFRKVLELREKLVAEFPAVARYRQQLAGNHDNLGILLTELGADPESAPRQALSLRAKLVADHPAVPQYRQDLAGSHHHLSLMFRHACKFREAKAAFRDALALREKLVAEFPAAPSIGATSPARTTASPCYSSCWASGLKLTRCIGRQLRSGSGW